MSVEKAKRMLKAIEDERQKGEMDEGAYQILKERYEGVLRGLGAEVKEEVAEAPEEEPKDVEGVALDLMSNIGDLREEIVVLGTEKKSTEGLLEDLKKKFDEGSIREEKFKRLSEKHRSKVGNLESKISDNQEQIKRAEDQLKGMAEEIKKTIKGYKKILKKIKKFT